MMIKKVKAIIFDVMGVIFVEGDDTNNLLIPFIEKECDYHDIPVLQERYLQASLGKISTQEFWKGISKDYPEIEKRYLDTQLKLDPEFVPVAERLRDRYTLAILSNDVSYWSAYLKRKFKLDRLFKEIIVSGDYGCRKPDYRLYKILLSRLDLPSSSCVLIDDNPKNLQSASELGMKTIYFERVRTEHLYESDCKVRSFTDLLQIFEFH